MIISIIPTWFAIAICASDDGVMVPDFSTFKPRQIRIHFERYITTTLDQARGRMHTEIVIRIRRKMKEANRSGPERIDRNSVDMLD